MGTEEITTNSFFFYINEGVVSLLTLDGFVDVSTPFLTPFQSVRASEPPLLLPLLLPVV